MMRSIMTITLTAVMLLTVLTGCGRNKNNNSSEPVATTVPNQTTTTERPDESTAPNTIPEAAGNATDRVENGVNDVVGGAENAVNDVVGGAENMVDDILGDDGVVNGDFNDGDVADPEAKDETVAATPQAR